MMKKNKSAAGRIIAGLILAFLPFIELAAQNSRGRTLREFAAQLQPIEWTLIWISVCLFGVILYLGYFLKTLAYDKFYASDSGGVSKIVAVGVLTTALFLGSSTEAMAQTGGPADFETTITLMLLLGIIAIQLVVIFHLWASIGSLLKKPIDRPVDKPYLMATTVWGALWKNMNKSVEIEREKDVLLDHAYDGIRELDNDLPPWWKWGFYITIIFSVIYLARYHVFQTAPLQMEEYEIAVARAEAERAALRATSPDITEETVVFLDSEEDLEIGKTLYVTNCAVCHGQFGEGGIGPNLVDDYWIHGGSIRDIFRVTKYGVIERGMTPWQDILTPVQIAQVSSFVKTLRDTDPPNQKEPEGELYVPEEETGDAEEADEAPVG